MGPADCIRRAHLISCLPTCPRSTSCSHPCHRMQRETLDGHQCAINDHHLLMKRTDGRGDPEKFLEVILHLLIGCPGQDHLARACERVSDSLTDELRGGGANLTTILTTHLQARVPLLLDLDLLFPAVPGPLHRPQSKTRPGDPENP